jgi:hypothetical protein
VCVCICPYIKKVDSFYICIYIYTIKDRILQGSNALAQKKKAVWRRVRGFVPVVAGLWFFDTFYILIYKYTITDLKFGSEFVDLGLQALDLEIKLSAAVW